MKIASGLPALMLLSASPALATNYVLTIQPAPNQVERMDNGRQVVDDVGERTTIRMMPPKGATDKRSGVRLYVTNRSDKPFNFGPANVTLKLADGTIVAMLTNDELMREERRREGWQRFGTAMAAAGRSMQASQAGTVTSYGNYSGNTTGTIGTTPFSATSNGSGVVTTYDPARAQMAQAAANQETQADTEALAQAQATNQANIDQFIQTTTVDPGATFGGPTIFNPPKVVKSGNAPVALTIIVDAGGEMHQFAATLQKAR
ncbi:hypothetical protein E2E30_09015 [Sphingomonas sp. AAP5]|uniref:hypothetical protein n=1 Tax=Sphingomonas sp. AAP5 TaxID=1523415 RepID=UPI001056E2C0|nr:hypothetical protein [Sphingomonas sp. AAP5]QBM75897.1 hypothetical protein E2E30_09015 [Sphingomonas sp. AAP5]